MAPRIAHWLSAIFGIHVPEYLVPQYLHLLILAWAICTWMAVRLARREGWDRLRLRCTLEALAFGYLGALAGARLFSLAQQAPIILRNPMDPSSWMGGGMVSYGGYAGGTLATLLWLRYRRVALAGTLDLLAVFLPLGIAITRVGCLLSGCCHGAVTALPWGIRYPAGSAAWEVHVAEGRLDPGSALSLPVHPSPLYESLFLVLLFLFLRNVFTRRGPSGKVLLVFCLTYPVGRFFLEFLRGDPVRGIYLGLSAGQWSSTVVFLGALAAVLWRQGRLVSRLRTHL